MLNIRKAPYTQDLMATKMKTIHGNRYVHLRGVNPYFDNCSIPVEVLIDRVQGSLFFSMLLEDIKPLDSNSNTVYECGNLIHLPANQPSINYIEDYLDTYSFVDLTGKAVDVKEYFIKNHIALFYSSGSIIDDMAYAEELKLELRKDLDIKPKGTCVVSSNVKEIVEELKKQNKDEGYYSAEKNLEDTLDNIMTFAESVGTKLKDYYEAHKEEIKQVSQEYLNREREEENLKDFQKIEDKNKKAVYDMLVYDLGFSMGCVDNLLHEFPYYEIFNGNIYCPYNNIRKLDYNCLPTVLDFPFGAKNFQCGLKCPKFNKK